ncbi:ArsR/SmtB family transcription factor [Spongiimicrobium salis]|uniref:ArsR/SmtB family transcription factor n=1 Tax=Spongiimicrobium salis TaxID=1667022 RepID=UPI00374D1452
MEEKNFVFVTSLLCEPSRAKIVWNLLDGRAYTASELALVSDLSPSAVSNHLSKLLQGGILRVDTQGRHRYYSFANTNIAYAVEALANLANGELTAKTNGVSPKKRIQYCRSCYDHLAGFIGVTITEALEKRQYLLKSGKEYRVTKEGWQWFSQFGIDQEEMIKHRRPLTRQCLDWSERKPHLAGYLGAIFFKKMLENCWFKKVEFSRELVITSKGRTSLYDFLGIVLE